MSQNPSQDWGNPSQPSGDWGNGGDNGGFGGAGGDFGSPDPFGGGQQRQSTSGSSCSGGTKLLLAAGGCCALIVVIIVVACVAIFGGNSIGRDEQIIGFKIVNDNQADKKLFNLETSDLGRVQKAPKGSMSGNIYEWKLPKNWTYFHKETRENHFYFQNFDDTPGKFLPMHIEAEKLHDIFETNSFWRGMVKINRKLVGDHYYTTPFFWCAKKKSEDKWFMFVRFHPRHMKTKFTNSNQNYSDSITPVNVMLYYSHDKGEKGYHETVFPQRKGEEECHKPPTKGWRGTDFFTGSTVEAFKLEGIKALPTDEFETTDHSDDE